MQKTNKKSFSILVATHKTYKMPKDEMYVPIHVGAKGKKSLGYKGDDSGKNISAKNPFFCELTGLYWGIHNLKSDYIGLVHYRRYFSLCKHPGKTIDERIDAVASQEDISKILSTTDIIVPKLRKYYIEDLYSHYAHTLFVEPLDITGEIIKELHPDYYPEFEKLHKRTSMHAFNMIIAKREILEDYCEWLFSILFELEKRTKNKNYSDFHARFYGRVSELLLDVYLNTHNIEYKEVKVIDIEKVNWPKKIIAFLKAKFCGVKYEKSF